MDLAVSSSCNFLEMERSILAEGLQLHEVLLRLTVKDRGSFGEVCFER